MLVRIIKNWDQPNLLRQTPGSSGLWEGVRFILDEDGPCDYAVVLNCISQDVVLECDPRNIWCIAQEPPIKLMAYFRKGYKSFHKVITSDIDLLGDKYVYDSLGLPWHVNKSYDELIGLERPMIKSKNLSWITSNKSAFSGHVDRMQFLNSIQDQISFDLFGKGFNFIEDKWDGLYPYKYSLAVENYRGPYYWTEKISDCFLSWTMPIYYGCTNLEEYFPRESFIKININEPEEAIEIIKESIEKKLWEKSIDAISHSRNLVLNEYNIFPYITKKISNQKVLNKTEINKLKGVRKTKLDTVIRLFKEGCEYFSKDKE